MLRLLESMVGKDFGMSNLQKKNKKKLNLSYELR
jgi:hypothetical protein